MKNMDIDSFLRDNKPQVKEDPAFLLEVQQKMRAVEGIKTEVDRQRRHGRIAVITALTAGLICGIIVTLLAYLYPIDPESVSEGVISSIRTFIGTWKHFLLVPVIGCAIALWFAIDSPKSASSRF
ncbi:MAG: hypothetical protein IKW20_06960 [Bacteroidales bacterium]|nr:hypothetical protein [Bacteroidales bacterium]